jgi:hypothetical protein
MARSRNSLRPLPPPWRDAFDLRLESPCLLDPAVDTPQDHLFFEPTRPNEQGWDWQARTERGHHTLDLLKLNRSARTGAYERLQVHLERVLEDAAELLSKADSLEKQRIWDKCLHHYIQPPQIPHRVASWWFLKYFLEKHNLQQDGLSMPDYPDDAGGPAAPPPRLGEGIQLPDGLTPEERLIILWARCSQHVPHDISYKAVEALCRVQPQTSKELCSLLEKTQPAMSVFLRNMCDGGRLWRMNERPERYSASPTAAAPRLNPSGS